MYDFRKLTSQNGVVLVFGRDLNPQEKMDSLWISGGRLRKMVLSEDSALIWLQGESEPRLSQKIFIEKTNPDPLYLVMFYPSKVKKKILNLNQTVKDSNGNGGNGRPSAYALLETFDQSDHGRCEMYGEVESCHREQARLFAISQGAPYRYSGPPKPDFFQLNECMVGVLGCLKELEADTQLVQNEIHYWRKRKECTDTFYRSRR